MKKVFAIVLVFVMLSFSAYAQGASEISYRLSELGLTVNIPSDIPVFTREIKDNDPHLAQFGLTKAQMDSLMESRNIYLNALSNDLSYELIVTMIESPLNDYYYLTDAELSAFTSIFKDTYKESGIDFIKSEIYNHPQAKFVKIYISQPNAENTVYGLQYHTVYDGKAINFTLQSYSGSISDSQEDLLQKIIDGVAFDISPEKEPTAETPSFTYTDERTGLSFIVPKNWVQTELSKDRETIDVKFSSVEEPGVAIMYGSADIWAQMTSSEKRGLTREDIGNSSFSLSEITEILNASEGTVEKVTLGGKEYFKNTRNEDTTVAGMSITVPMTILVRLENGYWYNFQLGGDATSEQYSDFETLVSSALYKTGSATVTKDNLNAGMSLLTTLFLSLVLTICVYSLPIFIYRFAIIKKPLPSKKARKICIIYAIIAFFVMAVILAVVREGNAAPGAAIFLWSWINYGVLTRGYTESAGHTPPANTSITCEPTNEDNTATAQALSLDEHHIGNQIFISSDDVLASALCCPYCGTTITDAEKFCHKCGKKLPD